MLYGYARKSAGSQKLEDQIDALRAAGCTHVFAETDNHKRPQLALALQAAGFGDLVVVTNLNRLARSSADLFELYRKLAAKGAGVRSLTEPITDPATPEGRFFPQFVEWFAAFDAASLYDRLSEGRRRAVERGQITLGRPSKLSPQNWNDILRVYFAGEATCEELARKYGIATSTVSRYIAIHRKQKLTRS